MKMVVASEDVGVGDGIPVRFCSLDGDRVGELEDGDAVGDLAGDTLGLAVEDDRTDGSTLGGFDDGSFCDGRFVARNDVGIWVGNDGS